MDKYKIISIIEGIIIIVLVVVLVLNKSSTTSPTITDNQDTSNKSKANKDYIGIYHINNYGRFNGLEFDEVNITINEDNTCDVSLYYAKELYTCKYKEISKDKLQLIISTYIAINDADKNNIGNNFTTGWKLGSSKEKCESKLKEFKQQHEEHYKDYNECKKVEDTTDIILLANGLLYGNKQFTKIK